MPAELIRLVGYKELKKKLGPDAWREVFPRLMQRVAEIGVRVGRSAAPVGATGDTAAGVTSRMTTGKFPSVKIMSTAKHAGYPYTTLLEYAEKYHHRGWLIDAMKGAQEELGEAFEAAAREIEAAWQL